MSLMICSTSHRQRRDRLLLLVELYLRVFYCTSSEPFFFFSFFHFMVYSVETVTEAF